MNKVSPPKLLKNFHWEQYCVPVVPPIWVIEKAEQTRQPVDWDNTQTYQEEETDPILVFPSLYRTRVLEQPTRVVITHLLPGSGRPTKGYLKKAP